MRNTRPSRAEPEAELALLDHEILVQVHDDRALSFDGDAEAFTKNAKAVAGVVDALDRRGMHIVETYKVLEASALTLARLGAMWDAFRQGIDRAKLTTPAKADALLEKLEAAGQADRASEIRDQLMGMIRQHKAAYLDTASALTVRRAMTALVLARMRALDGDALKGARSRMQALSQSLGAAKLRELVEQTIDPGDPSGARRLVFHDELFQG